MHGVGYPFFAEAMKVFGFAPFITVAEQVVFTVTVVISCM